MTTKPKVSGRCRIVEMDDFDSEALDLLGPACIEFDANRQGSDESRAEKLPAKCTIKLRAGDVLRMLTPGGGGWGRGLGFDDGGTDAR